MVTWLKTLGELKLEGARFTRPTPLLLLSYLSLEGPQHRRHLAELFWQDGKRMKSLSMTLTRLRQGAGEVIKADDKQAQSTLKSDAQELLEVLDKSDWESAASLYTGAFLEGVVLDDWSSELEEWVYSTREYLAERVQYALLKLAEDAAKLQDFDKARAFAERSYRLPGLSGTELSNLKRIYPLLCAGHSSLAPDVRKELEDFGLNLSLSTEAARAAFAPIATPKTTLPVRNTSFVGRDEELTELATLLHKTSVSLLTLLGPAGVGKTRLALQLAHEQLRLGAFKEGIYFVSLDALRDAELIASSLVSHLGLSQQGNTEPLTQLTNFIGENHTLIVLDNFEHLIAGSSLLSHLLSQCPNLKLLVTSRERLKLEEEHLYTLEGLVYPTSLSSDANLSEAVQLFRERAQQVKPDSDLAQNLTDVIRICKLVEGLPLGIELAASWVRLLSCRDIASEIERGLELLATDTQNVPQRHRSLKAAFEQSWSLLTDKEQAVLRKLSVFVGGFQREAAREVAGATIPVLASLVDKSLLRVLPNGRYDRHPLLYQFSREKLVQNQQEESAVRERQGAYFLAFLSNLKSQIEGRKEQESCHAIAEELNNIRASWLTMLASADAVNLMSASESLLHYFLTTGQVAEGMTLFKLGIQQLETSPEPSAKLATLRFAELSLLYALGRFNEALPKGLELLQAFQISGDLYSTMNTYLILGKLVLRLGSYEDAERYNEKGFALAQQLGDNSALATSLLHMAMTADQGSGDFSKAKQYYEQALALNRKLENAKRQVIITNNLGNACLGQGELEEAKRYFGEGLGTARQIGFRPIIPYFLYNLAVIAKRQMAHETCQSYLSEALTLIRAMHDKSLEASILGMLGVVATKLTKTSEAYYYLQESLRVAQEIADLPVLLENLFYVAEWHEQQGNIAEAVMVAGFVAQHPACTGNNRTLATGFCKRLQRDIAKGSRALVQDDQTASLETFITSILNSEPSKTHEVHLPPGQTH